MKMPVAAAALVFTAAILLAGCTPQVGDQQLAPATTDSSVPKTTPPPTKTPAKVGAHFAFSQTEPAGYKTGIDVSVSPLEITLDTADAAPGYNYINVFANATGAATNLTTGHNQDLVFGLGVYVVYPAGSLACSPGLASTPSTLGSEKTTCDYLVGDYVVGQLAVASNGQAPLYFPNGASTTPLQLQVTDAQKDPALAALNAPLGFILANHDSDVNLAGYYTPTTLLTVQCTLQSGLGVVATSVQGLCQ